MSKRLFINANIEDQDVGVLDPRFHHGMPWHSQSLPGLAGHSRDGLHIPAPCTGQHCLGRWAWNAWKPQVALEAGISHSCLTTQSILSRN